MNEKENFKKRENLLIKIQIKSIPIQSCNMKKNEGKHPKNLNTTEKKNTDENNAHRDGDLN